MAMTLRSAGRGLLCSTALTLALGSIAHAQDTTVYSLDPIIVERADESIGAADKSSSIYVSEAELERARMGDVKDLFAGIASVSVGGGIPIAQKIFVNGVDMLNLGITVDGVSQNNRVFHHVSANAFDPGLMKTVRVDPGVATADAGPNALAGAVTMETVDAADILEDGDNFGGNIRLSYSDNGDTFTKALTLAGREGGFEYLLYGKAADGDSYEDGSGTVFTGTGAALRAGLVKLAYEGDAGHRLEFSAQQMQDNEMRAWRPNFGSTSTTLYEYNTQRSVYALNYEYTQGSAFWNPEIALGFSETIVDRPEYYASNGDSNTYSLKFQNTVYLNDVDTLVFGLDAQERSGTYTGIAGGSDTTPVGPITETSQNVGVFAQLRMEPTDRLSLSTGLRADAQKFTGTDGSVIENTGISANASLEYALTDTLSLRAGYSTVFGGLQIEDNFVYDVGFDYSALSATRSQNLVVGLDWEYGNATLGGDVFITQIDDVREVSSSYDYESRGFNLYGTYGWDTGFARMTFSHSEGTRDGEVVSSYGILDSGAPLGSVLAFEVQQELPNLNLVVGGGLDVAFDYDSGADEYSDIIALPGYEVVNVFAEYRPPNLDNWVIRAEINNLFDETYADRATYGADYDGFSVINEPGRTVSLIATATF